MIAYFPSLKLTIKFKLILAFILLLTFYTFGQTPTPTSITNEEKLAAANKL